MGRYIGNGLVTRIIISPRRRSSLGDELPKALKTMSQHVDLSLYDVEERDGTYEFSIKPDLVNQHFKNLLREVSFNPKNINFLQDSYQGLGLPVDFWDADFVLKKNEYYELMSNDVMLSRENGNHGCFNQVYLHEEKNDFRNVFIEICIIPLGTDYDKIYSEDETYLLYLLNSDLYRFQNPLSTAFVYCILY